jgi:hypothetical protein
VWVRELELEPEWERERGLEWEMVVMGLNRPPALP